MPDLQEIKDALKLSLQAGVYSALGPASAELLSATRQDLARATQGWPEWLRGRLVETAVRLERERHELDRGRNHFMKDFRARNGADGRGWAAELKAQFEKGIGVFTKKKEEAEEAAAAELHRESQRLRETK